MLISEEILALSNIMFEYFPKIQYGFSGGTFEVTDIFKFINVNFNENSIFVQTKLPGERPDQLSNRLYNDPQYYWSLFLVNGIKNPLRQWAQTQQSYINQIESEYAGWEYQFANTSIFKPDSDVLNQSKVVYANAGTNTVSVITENNEVVIWGSNKYGQISRCSCLEEIDPEIKINVYGGSLGYGLSGYTSIKFSESSGLIPQKIDISDTYTALLLNNGKIYVWGYWGTAGNQDPRPKDDCSVLNDIVLKYPDIKFKDFSASAGYSRFVAITEDGDLVAFRTSMTDGSEKLNSGFTLAEWDGNPNTGERILYYNSNPEVTHAFQNYKFKKIEDSETHFIGIMEDNRVYVSGEALFSDSSGLATVDSLFNPYIETLHGISSGTITHYFKDVSASQSFNAGVSLDGTPVVWGTLVTSALLPTLWNQSGITAVAVDCGGNDVCWVMSNGTVECRSLGSSPLITDLPAGISSNSSFNISNISVGDTHAIAKSAEGKVYVWGQTNYRQDYNEPTVGGTQFIKLITPIRFNNIDSFSINFLDEYDGTELDGINSGDLIIFETGSGPYNIKCYGSGGVTSADACGSPQFGQSLVPGNLDVQQNIVQVSSGNYFSSVLDSSGYIYVWGKDISLPTSSFNKQGSMWVSNGNVKYSYIEASGDRIIAIKEIDGSLDCFGSCNDFNSYYGGENQFIKTFWTSGLSGGLGIKSDGSVVNYGLTGPNSLYTADCGINFCVGIDSSDYGLTAWGAYEYDQTNVPTGITGFTLISVTHRHSLALNNDGQIYAWGLTGDGQLDIPSGEYSAISTGKSHSAAINKDNELVVWGKITIYGDNCPGEIEVKVVPQTLTGKFTDISSGYDHILLKGSGTNKKYIGVVESVDSLYKRVFVKTYQFPDTSSVFFDDPSGTIVSVWRYDADKKIYEQIKTIQHKLLSIQKYLDSTKYVNVSGFIMDPTDKTQWKTLYLENYQNSETDERFITLRKEFLDLDLYNKTQIKTLSKGDVIELRDAVAAILQNNTTTNTIII